MLCQSCNIYWLANRPASYSRLQAIWLRCRHIHSYCTSINSRLFRINSSNHRTYTCDSSTKWSQPQGYDTGIKIYHPLVKDKVSFILKQEKTVQWYACGPTVYDSPHIGHASSYVRLDIIRRILAAVFNIDTNLMMNVTDVDDKIIIKSNETGQPIDKITKLYEAEFFADMAKLGVLPPSIIARVRDYIPQIVMFVKKLEDKGFAYRTDGGSVYFDVKKYGKYGQFAFQRDTQDEGQSNVKRNSQDFALWKGSKPGEPWWSSPWGQGRPGWHVECSAMASSVFGANFDVHSGGEDLVFPHHENELAQSCAYHGNDQWVNYWLHTGHLYLSGQSDKMSKSLKNVISVSDLLAKYSPSHFRMLCLLTNYKKRIEFSEERMQKAVAVTSAINKMIQQCEAYLHGRIDCTNIPEAEFYERLQVTRRAVEKAFADDFNTPQALANVMRLIKYTNQFLGSKESEKTVTSRSCAPVAAVCIYLKKLMCQLGVDAGRKMAREGTETDVHFHKAVDTVVAARTKIRDLAKDKKNFINIAGEHGIPEKTAKELMKSLYKPLWETSDTIRHDMLSSVNIQINDGADGSTWNVVHPGKKVKKSEDQSTTDITIPASGAVTE
ncbi:cysteine--tRNA ligase, mitochondrial [Elysia marginata]|uniref:cysteine--tRNA ligase n=1 Tax=Elysia marginata TaxID=1093978 RepID=A0AAV4JZH6_9GAST|nr:cysteine--tRNA ligase, mitochondrial [Elysia marginata]